MSYELIKAEECSTSDWSGGTTTQIYISPKEAVYGERTFDFRISSATVNLEQSDFTKLEGYNRYIMLLEGEMHLEHEGHHTKTLALYDWDYFSGGWNTKSYGKCRDFNLMLREGILGGMAGISGEAVECNTGKATGFLCLTKGTRFYMEAHGRKMLVATLDPMDFLFFARDERSADYLVTAENSEAQGILAVEVFAYPA